MFLLEIYFAIIISQHWNQGHKNPGYILLNKTTKFSLLQLLSSSSSNRPLRSWRGSRLQWGQVAYQTAWPSPDSPLLPRDWPDVSIEQKRSLKSVKLYLFSRNFLQVNPGLDHYFFCQNWKHFYCLGTGMHGWLVTPKISWSCQTTPYKISTWAFPSKCNNQMSWFNYLYSLM